MHTELLSKILETPLAQPMKREIAPVGPMLHLNYQSEPTQEIGPTSEKYVAELIWRMVVFSHPDRHDERREALSIIHPAMADHLYGEVRREIFKAYTLGAERGLLPADLVMLQLRKIIEITEV